MRKKRQRNQRRQHAASGLVMEVTNSCIRDPGCYLQVIKRKKNPMFMSYISKQYDCLLDDNFEFSSNI